MDFDEINTNTYDFKSINDILNEKTDVYTDYKNTSDIFNSNVITNY